MSALDATDVLRPRPALQRAIMGVVLKSLPAVWSVMRRVWPIAHFGSTYVVTRYDDVLEVFATNAAFGVPYKAKLDLLMDGEPFILGEPDGPQYRADLAALRGVVTSDDLSRLGRAVETQAAAIVEAGGGRLEVVDTLVRRIAFDVIADYLGVPPPANGDLRVWATRLFEYQFIAGDQSLLDEVRQIAPALRAHIQGEIERRRSSPEAKDDVLGRCLVKQAEGDAWFTDARIRTAVAGLVIGGPPQPPMVVPQALEQLLARPDALRGAQAAARANDDDALFGFVIEAMRFDPLGPALPRTALTSWTVAEGTPRQCLIPANATVMVSFESAMMDERRVRDPRTFDPRRQPGDYVHFGHGVHECFGRHINRATLHMMLKPLLKRPGLRRAPGAAGRLRKNGAFAESLVVEFD